MKYDDASWHHGGDFPADLPHEAAATHAGMFLAWAVLNGLGGELFESGSSEFLELANRSVTPGAFFLRFCDGKLTDEDLSKTGNDFAESYFNLEAGLYLADYEESVGAGLLTLYHVADTWGTFDALVPVLSNRYQSWAAARSR